MGSASLYNGNHLVREAGDGVVSVVIQYRLGLFGFLAGEKIKEGGTLNAGLRKCFDYGKKEEILTIVIQWISRQHYNGCRTMSV